MKHGPIALIDKQMPVIFIAVKDAVYEKVISNIEEVKARGGWVIAVISEGDHACRSLCDEVIEIPQTIQSLSPVLTVIPLQLLAYYTAVKKKLYTRTLPPRTAVSAAMPFGFAVKT